MPRPNRYFYSRDPYSRRILATFTLIRDEDDHGFSLGVAYVHPKEQAVKARGREISEDRAETLSDNIQINEGTSVSKFDSEFRPTGYRLRSHRSLSLRDILDLIDQNVSPVSVYAGRR